MRARRGWGRTGLLVFLGLLWLALTVRGLTPRDVVWVSVIFFLSGLYGTGRWEWIKTEHRGVGLPAPDTMAAIREGRVIFSRR